MTDARFIASENYFEAIEDAILETPRGRWFLREYARRNRQADTLTMLQAIDRLMHSVRSDAALGHVEILRRELQEMSHSIVQTRREIAAIKPADPGHNRIMAATEELDAIVTATERATSDILTAAERLQELVSDLRETGASPRICEEIAAMTTNILMACSFQDLTGQRTTKVVNVLRYLEQRVNAMIEIWGVEGAAPPEPEEAVRPDAHLLSGPAREGEGVSQADVDRLLHADGEAAEAGHGAAQAEAEHDPKVVRIAPVSPTTVSEDQAEQEQIDQASIDALFA